MNGVNEKGEYPDKGDKAEGNIQAGESARGGNLPHD
jgi:hypothetical protein